MPKTIRIVIRHTGILLFLGIFLFESIGCYILPGLYQMVLKYSVHQQIKKNIPAGKICILKIPHGKNAATAPRISFQGDDECWFEGKLYDIVKVGHDAGAHIYYCVFDEKETALINWFTTLLHQKFSPYQDKNPARHFLLFIITLFCTPLLLVIFLASASEWKYAITGCKKYLNYIPPFTPPPKQG